MEGAKHSIYFNLHEHSPLKEYFTLHFKFLTLKSNINYQT